MKTADVNGAKLEFEVKGSGEPVLLISPVLADGFRPFLSEPELADRYKLILYNRRGWAGSTYSLGPVSIADPAADEAALLDRLGFTRTQLELHTSWPETSL